MSLPDEIHDLYTTMEDYYRDLTFYFVHDRGDENDMFDLFVSKEIKANQPCSKFVNYCWKCRECSNFENSVICTDCYEQAKNSHKGHHLMYKAGEGCCDCGDLVYWKADGTCKNHLPLMLSQSEIDDYIIKTFGEGTVNRIKNSFDDMFGTMAKYLSVNTREYFAKNKLYRNDLHYKIVERFLTFIFQCCSSNLALLYILSDYLTKSYNTKCNHDCISVDYTNKKVELINNSSVCKCPFIRLIYLTYDNTISVDLMEYSLLKNQKLKTYMGISFFSLYSDMLFYSYEMTKSLTWQVTHGEVAHFILNSDSFMMLLMSKLESLCKDKIKANDKYDEMLAIAHILVKFEFMFPGMIIEHIKEVSTKFFIYKAVINILCYVTNKCIIYEHKDINKSDFHICHTLSDKASLQIFNTMCTILDFSNEKLSEAILVYISNKIYEEDYLTLKQSEFSYAITIFRAFSIYIVKYMFSYSYNKTCDLFYAFKVIKEKIPHYKEVSEIIIKEMYKFFGFVLSVENGRWNAYGDLINRYHRDYFQDDFPRYFDFALMKVLLSQSENSECFTIENIITSTQVYTSEDSDIKNCYINENNLLKGDFFYLSEEKKKKCQLGTRAIKLIHDILRSKNCLIETYLYDYQKLKNNKYELCFQDKIIQKEKEILIVQTQFNLIHTVISHENSCPFSEISKAFPSYMDTLIDPSQRKEFIFSFMSHSVLHNQDYRYYIKDEALKCCDTQFISVRQNVNKAETYLIEFKSKITHILNTVEYPSLMSEVIFDSNCYKNFYDPINVNNSFFNPPKSTFIKNIDYIRTYIFLLLEEKNFMYISAEFVNLLIKMLLVFIQDSNVYKSYYTKLTSLCSLVKPISEYKANFEYLKERITKLDSKMNAQKDNAKTIESNLKKSKANDIKNKYKQKFKAKLNTIQNLYQNDMNNAITAEEENKQCVICKGILNSNADIEEQSLGKLCYIHTDAIFYKSSDVNRLLEYKKYNKSPLSYHDYLSQFNCEQYINEYSHRILTCNHYVHKECYDKYKPSQLQKQFGIECNCPLCGKANEICLPDMRGIKNESTREYIKSKLSFKELINSSKGYTLTKQWAIEPLVKKSKMLVGIMPFYMNQLKGTTIDETENFNKLNSEEEYDKYIKEIKNNFYYLYNLLFNCDNKEYVTEIDLYASYYMCYRMLVNIGELKWDAFILNDVSSIIQKIKGNDVIEVFRVFSDFLFYIMFFARMDTFENIQSIIGIFVPYIAFEVYLKHIYCTNHLCYDQSFNALLSFEKIKSFYNNSTNDIKDWINNSITELLFRTRIAKQISYLTNYCSIQLNEDFSLSSLLSEFSFQDCIDSPQKLLSNDKFSLPPFLESSFSSYSEYYSSTINNLIHNYTIQNTTQLLSPEILKLGYTPKIKLINLPEHLIDLLAELEKVPCYYCKETDTKYLICLTCSRKLCCSLECMTESKAVSFIHHMRLCSGGNGAYLIAQKGKIAMFSRYYCNDDQFLYLTEFGDKVDKIVTIDYKINRDLYDKISHELIFVNQSVRKILNVESRNALRKKRSYKDWDNNDSYENMECFI